MVRPSWIPRPLAALLLVAAFSLGLGLAFKDSCNGPNWDGFQYRALCYNDVVPLYYAHGFDADIFPYVEHADRDAQQPKDGYDPARPDTHWGFVEYPVLTGLHMWFAARLGTAWVTLFGGPESGATFLYANAILLSGFALGTVTLLWRMTGDARRVALFAAGTPLFLYAFHNWDLMAVFFMVLTLYWFERDKYFESGVALSLGASAKLFPIVMAPFLFFVLWRRAYAPPQAPRDVLAELASSLRRARAAWALFWGTLLGYLVVNLPFVLFGSREMFFEVFRFHLRRTPNFETIWWVGKEYGNKWRIDELIRLEDRSFIDPILSFLFVAAVVGVITLVWRQRWGPRQAAFGALLLFLILNKVFSVQYALWVLPFFTLLPLPLWSYGLFLVADAWVYATIFPFFTSLGTDRFEAARAWLSLAIINRTATLVLLLSVLLRRAGRALHPIERRSVTQGTAAAPTGVSSTD